MSDTYNSQLRKRILGRYRDEVHNGENDFAEVAVWAIREKLWDESFEDKVEKLRRDLAAAAREEKFTDVEGNHVRANYCVRREAVRPNGQKYIQTVWAHIDVASYPFMEESFRQRKRALLDPAFQGHVDVTHYNKYRRGKNPEIPFCLDLTKDIADMMQDTEYKPQPFEGL